VFSLPIKASIVFIGAGNFYVRRLKSFFLQASQKVGDFLSTSRRLFDKDMTQSKLEQCLRPNVCPSS